MGAVGLSLDVDRYLLEPLVVVLDVAVLEEDHGVVLVRLHALLAESVRALVAGALDLFALVPVQLAVGDARVARVLPGPQHGAGGADGVRHSLLERHLLVPVVHLEFHFASSLTLACLICRKRMLINQIQGRLSLN